MDIRANARGAGVQPLPKVGAIPPARKNPQKLPRDAIILHATYDEQMLQLLNSDCPHAWCNPEFDRQRE